MPAHQHLVELCNSQLVGLLTGPKLHEKLALEVVLFAEEPFPRRLLVLLQGRVNFGEDLGVHRRDWWPGLVHLLLHQLLQPAVAVKALSVRQERRPRLAAPTLVCRWGGRSRRGLWRRWWPGRGRPQSGLCMRQGPSVRARRQNSVGGNDIHFLREACPAREPVPVAVGLRLRQLRFHGMPTRMGEEVHCCLEAGVARNNLVHSTRLVEAMLLPVLSLRRPHEALDVGVCQLASRDKVPEVFHADAAIAVGVHVAQQVFGLDCRELLAAHVRKELLQPTHRELPLVREAPPAEGDLLFRKALKRLLAAAAAAGMSATTGRDHRSAA
mmetsp:Transcript_146323/g.407612  ORF Transcript_146323/g.407612 Transcript_146323/m.407612 type:complete len:326 (+) Transcript_146323:331-1308(+)